ncbi:MAG: response regulator [Sphingomonadaceae bacterium]|nr:response regulator [Sphingomonadaceae bacterium]
MSPDALLSDAVVLVVEDELLVRMITVDVLVDAGFQVIEADSADAALPIIDARDDLRILVTDVRMPGSMDGLALARHVSARRDDVVILITSGHARPTREELPPRASFIGKPYRAETLLAEVRQLTAAAR